MMNRYADRREAGKILAQELKQYANRHDTLVLALPRGGVPVAFEVATLLHAPLDVFIVRKLGVPGQHELAMGAIAMGNTQVFNPDIIKELNVAQHEIQAVIAYEQQELKRREALYRGHHAFPPLTNKILILVDDGIATGATMRVAIKALRQLNPAKIIVSVPVAHKQMVEKIRPLVDEFICPLMPTEFYAVGAWYDDFSQTEDNEVYALLKEAKLK